MVLAFEGQLEAISAEPGSTRTAGGPGAFPASPLTLPPAAADSVPGLERGLTQFTGTIESVDELFVIDAYNVKQFT